MKRQHRHWPPMVVITATLVLGQISLLGLVEASKKTIKAAAAKMVQAQFVGLPEAGSMGRQVTFGGHLLTLGNPTELAVTTTRRGFRLNLHGGNVGWGYESSNDLSYPIHLVRARSGSWRLITRVCDGQFAHCVPFVSPVGRVETRVGKSSLAGALERHIHKLLGHASDFIAEGAEYTGSF